MTVWCSFHSCYFIVHVRLSPISLSSQQMTVLCLTMKRAANPTVSHGTILCSLCAVPRSWWTVHGAVTSARVLWSWLAVLMPLPVSSWMTHSMDRKHAVLSLLYCVMHCPAWQCNLLALLPCTKSLCTSDCSWLTTRSSAFPHLVADITFARSMICLAKCVPNLLSEEENVHVLIKVLLNYVSGAEGNRKRVCVHLLPITCTLTSAALLW